MLVQADPRLPAATHSTTRPIALRLRTSKRALPNAIAIHQALDRRGRFTAVVIGIRQDAAVLVTASTSAAVGGAALEAAQISSRRMRMQWMRRPRQRLTVHGVERCMRQGMDGRDHLRSL